MKRVVLLAVAAGAVLAVGVQRAGATNECRGLQICVRVPGPWVVVPATRSTPRPRVDFQLTCPRGFIVAGLDAQLSDRAIDVDFLGRLGSPVGPGVTTSRSALFRGTYTGTFPTGPTFRPHLGCVPASGGGPGPVPMRRPDAVFPPSEPTIRRVRNVRLRVGNTRAIAACARGERFVAGWHAIGFFTAASPSAPLTHSIGVTRTLLGRVAVTVRGGSALRGIRAVVQVGAVCGGGSR